jgi:replicative DNA helicase
VGSLNVALDRLLELEAIWRENQSIVWGTSTGFPSIDAVTGGLHDGEVMVIAARTSQGKTALANQIAFNVAEQIAEESGAGKPTGKVLIYSPEMDETMIALRHASVMSLVPSTLIRRGVASEVQLDAWNEAVDVMRLFDPFISIRASEDMSVQDIVADVQSKWSGSTPIRLVVVDYLQYLSSMSGKDNSYEQVSSIIKTLKTAANKFKVPMLVLSQMNRKAASNDEEDVPELHELEGSGKIEARADTVGILWRPVRLDENPNEAHPATFAIRKNRNGPVGLVTLNYIPALTMFRDPEWPREEVML